MKKTLIFLVLLFTLVGCYCKNQDVSTCSTLLHANNTKEASLVDVSINPNNKLNTNPPRVSNNSSSKVLIKTTQSSNLGVIYISFALLGMAIGFVILYVYDKVHHHKPFSDSGWDSRW